MKSRYFCAFHTEKMKACEPTAIHNWTEMMRRGVQAYIACRIDAANIYLHSAFDIALLRAQRKQNEFFTAMHLTKPAEFLIQLMLIDNQFNQAIILLSRIASIESYADENNEAEVSDFLASQYQKIELAEKAHLKTPNSYASSNDSNAYTHEKNYQVQ